MTMPRPRATPRPAFFAAAALLAAGCGDTPSSPVVRIPDERPSVQDVFVDRTAIDSNGAKRYYQDAVPAFRAYLAGHPHDADAHLEFGILLADLEMDGEALFHLNLFLDAAPDSARRTLAQSRLDEIARRSASGAGLAAGDVMAALDKRNLDYARLREAYGTLQSTNEVLVAENEKLRGKVAELDKRISNMVAGDASKPAQPQPGSLSRLTVQAPPAPAAPPRPAPGATSTPPTTTRPVSTRGGTWPVKPGDTFSNIAHKALGDRNRAREIRDLNTDQAGKFGLFDELPVGIILTLP